MDQPAETRTGVVARESNRGLPIHLIMWKIWAGLENLGKHFGKKRYACACVYVYCKNIYVREAN